MSSLFISYARADLEAVRSLTDGLKRADYDVWFDQKLNAGDVWWDRILSSIRECSVFLFALSDESRRSRACLAELDYATDLRRPILPIRVGPVSSPITSPVGARQIVPYVPDDARSAFPIGKAIDMALAQGAVPMPDPLPNPPEMPLAYLLEIDRQLDATQLSFENQLKVVDELKRKLQVETEPEVHRLIFATLHNLRNKRYAAAGVLSEIDAILRNRESLPAEPPADEPFDRVVLKAAADATDRAPEPANRVWWARRAPTGSTNGGGGAHFPTHGFVTRENVEPPTFRPGYENLDRGPAPPAGPPPVIVDGRTDPEVAERDNFFARHWTDQAARPPDGTPTPDDDRAPTESAQPPASGVAARRSRTRTLVLVLVLVLVLAGVLVAVAVNQS